MNKLIIKTNPDHWDHSIIIAQGVMKNGYGLNSSVTQIKASHLPQRWYDVWQGIVELIKTQGDGDIVCVMAAARLKAKDMQPLCNEGEEPLQSLPEPADSCELLTYWQWPDGRESAPVTTTIDDPEAIALLRYLTTTEAYESIN